VTRIEVTRVAWFLRPSLVYPLQMFPTLRAGSQLLVLGLLTTVVACSWRETSPVRRADHRVYIIGFDGMDPTLARK
jgi:hypothetical protein